MKKIVERAERISKLFPRMMSKEERFINLVEEIGELANAIAIKENHKSIKRKRSDLQDSFADVFYNLIILSSLYHIDLEEEINTMMNGLEQRIRNRDFDDENINKR